MHIQKLFVIIAFNETLLERAVETLALLPGAGPRLQKPFKGFLERQKHKFRRKSGKASDVKVGRGGGLVARFGGDLGGEPFGKTLLQGLGACPGLLRHCSWIFSISSSFLVLGVSNQGVRCSFFLLNAHKGCVSYGGSWGARADGEGLTSRKEWKSLASKRQKVWRK